LSLVTLCSEWIASCTGCGHFGKYDPLKPEALPYAHVTIEKYCGVYLKSPQRLAPGVKAARAIMAEAILNDKNKVESDSGKSHNLWMNNCIYHYYYNIGGFVHSLDCGVFRLW
jgi:hypothetical protein